MITDNSAFKYETQYNGTFEITQCFTNGTVIYSVTQQKLGIVYVALNHIHLI